MKQCQVHKTHRPRVVDVDTHHVWPLGHGGPDVPENRIVVCPTGHRNIHELIREYLHHNAEPPWEVRRMYAAGERFYARLGWRRMKSGTLTPAE